MRNLSDPVITFSKAITRSPSACVTRGLRSKDAGDPDFLQLERDHQAYVDALKAAGANVLELDPLDALPDAIFVEDTALCLPDCAILMRPSSESRRQEVAPIADDIRNIFQNVFEISGPGFIEGGDILYTGREILVGISERTNHAGIAELAGLVEPRGYRVRTVETPRGVLHLKTDCSLVGTDTILSTQRLAASGCFADYTVLIVPRGEENAANTIRLNNTLIMSDGFPKTSEILLTAGFDMVRLNNSECAKIDGGMSCLSLRIA